jgi:hypothetical protein
MKHKRIIIISLSLLIVIPLIYFFLLQYPYLRNEVARYDGDGVIEDDSCWFFTYPLPGYFITFPLFDLDRPFDETYSISNLPVLDDVGVYLIVESENCFDDKKLQTLHAKIEFTLTDSKGEVALEVNSYLKDMSWMYKHHGVVDGHRLYNLDTSFFTPIKHEIYKLHVQYFPDETLTHRKGYVFIKK